MHSTMSHYIVVKQRLDCNGLRCIQQFTVNIRIAKNSWLEYDKWKILFTVEYILQNTYGI
jgi:hypothetical protein